MGLSKGARMQQYREYIVNHIYNVQNQYNFYMPVWEASGLIDDFEDLNAQILAHDSSKWDPEEFDPYMDRFFPEDPLPKGVKVPATNEFNLAWLHHIHNNPHHPEHWVLYEEDNGKLERTVFDMPANYIIEMLSDWAGMSVYHNDTVWAYWESKGHDKVFSENTKRIVETLIYKMKEYYESVKIK